MRTPLQSYELVRRELGKMTDEGIIEASGLIEERPHHIKCIVVQGSKRGFFVFPCNPSGDATVEREQFRRAVSNILTPVSNEGVF